MPRSEFSDAYEEDEEALRGAILNEPISALEPRKHVVVSPGAALGEALGLMREHNTGCVLSVEDTRLVGIFTERDLLGVVQEGRDTSQITVGQVMTRDPEVLRPANRIALALNRMSVGGFRHIPLVDAESRPVGIVAMRDIVRFIVSLFPDVVLTTPPDPTAIPKEYGG